MSGVVRDGERLPDGLQLLLDEFSLGFPLAPADGEVLRHLVTGGGRRLKPPCLGGARVGCLLLSRGGGGGWSVNKIDKTQELEVIERTFWFV